MSDCNADNCLTMAVVVGIGMHMTCACLSMYAYLCTRCGQAWLPGNDAWDITCDILLVHIAASNSRTASVHISGVATQAGLQQQDQGIIADTYKHVKLPDGLLA